MRKLEDYYLSILLSLSDLVDGGGSEDRASEGVDGHENPRESDGRGVAITWLSSRMASGTSGAKNRHQCR
jgi:hypothetical protein